MRKKERKNVRKEGRLSVVTSVSHCCWNKQLYSIPAWQWLTETVVLYAVSLNNK